MPAYRDLRRGGVWRYRKLITLPNGSRLRIEGSPNVDTKAAAEQAELDRIKFEEDAIRNPPREEVPTFAKFAETFMATYAKTNNKISEQTAKRSILDHHLLPALGSKRLDRITVQDVEELKAKLLDERKSAKRVNNILIVLSKILRYADEIDLIERAPKIKTLKVQRQKFDFFTEPDFEKLVVASAQEPMWHAAVLGAGEAGLRMGEILALEFGDIDFKAGMLTVARNDWRGQIGSPKSGQDRRIPLTARLASALRAIRHLKSRLVFCHGDGARWTLTTMRTGLARQQKRAGLRRTGWHALRHSFCSHLAARGVPAIAIKELAGHSSIHVTNRYMHGQDETLRAAIGRLERTGYGQTA